MRPETERAWYGFDHAEAGAILVEDWGLAADQVEAIRWHHQPAQAERGSMLAAVLAMADRGAYEMGCGGALVPPDDGEGRRILGASPEQIATALGRARAGFGVHREIFV
jgi:hypothetical protein